MLGNRQSNVADPASTLTATLSAAGPASLTAPVARRTTITFTTDAPSAANGAVTITDGDASLVIAEVMEVFIELEDSVQLITTLINELRTDHATQVTLNAELITDHATFITDITDNRTAINAILNVLEEMGFMVAT